MTWFSFAKQTVHNIMSPEFTGDVLGSRALAGSRQTLDEDQSGCEHALPCWKVIRPHGIGTCRRVNPSGSLPRLLLPGVSDMVLQRFFSSAMAALLRRSLRRLSEAHLARSNRSAGFCRGIALHRQTAIARGRARLRYRVTRKLCRARTMSHPKVL